MKVLDLSVGKIYTDGKRYRKIVTFYDNTDGVRSVCYVNVRKVSKFFSQSGEVFISESQQRHCTKWTFAKWAKEKCLPNFGDIKEDEVK